MRSPPRSKLSPLVELSTLVARNLRNIPESEEHSLRKSENA